MQIIPKAKFHLAKLRKVSRRRMLIKVRMKLRVVKRGLAQEKVETKEMLAIYQKYTLGKATKEEMKTANTQFVDLLKGLGLSVIVILPFSPITIPAVVKLGKKVGVDVLPSAFNETEEQKNR